MPAPQGVDEIADPWTPTPILVNQQPAVQPENLNTQQLPR